MSPDIPDVSCVHTTPIPLIENQTDLAMVHPREQRMDSSAGNRLALEHSKRRSIARRAASLVRTFVVFCCAGLVWAWILPMWQGPDEIAHFSYVQYMAYHNLPPKVRYVPPGRQAWQTGPSPSVIRAARLMHAGQVAGNPANHLHPSIRERTTVLSQLSNYSSEWHNRATSQNYVGIYPPLYYGAAGKLLKWMNITNVLNQAYCARLFSSVLLGVFGVFCWFLLRHVMPNHKARESLAVVLPLLFPTLSMLGGVVNNDVLMDTCCMVLFCVVVDVLRRRVWTVKAAVLYGAAIGFAFVTKPGVYVLIATTLMVITFQALRTGALRKWSFLAFSGAFVCVIAGISTSWALVSLHYYHSLIPPLTYQATGNWPRTGEWFVTHLLLSGAYQMDIMVYQTVSGINFPWWVQPIRIHLFYDVWSVLVVGLIVCGLWQLQREDRALFVVSLAWGGVVFSFLWYTAFQYLLHTGTHFLQGRYFLAVLPVVLYLFAMALRASSWVLNVVLLASMAVYLTVLAATVERFYNTSLLSMILGNVGTFVPDMMRTVGVAAFAVLCIYVVWTVVRSFASPYDSASEV